MRNPLKYKFGILEIVAIVIGLFGIILFEPVKSNVFAHSGVGKTVVEHVWVACIAGICGPATGGLIGFIGATAICVYSGEPNWVIYSIALCVFGVLIGRYSDTYGIREGRFDLKSAKLLAAAVVVATIIHEILFIPFAEFIIVKSDLYEILTKRIVSAIYIIIASIVVLIPFYYLYSFIFRLISKKNHK